MEIAAATMQAWQQQDCQELDRYADIFGDCACFDGLVGNLNNLNVNVASSTNYIVTAVFPDKQIAKSLIKTCPEAIKLSLTVALESDPGCSSSQETAFSLLKRANIQEYGYCYLIGIMMMFDIVTQRTLTL